jgi:RNA polymerase sigma-70 factor (ECF subfamily)
MGASEVAQVILSVAAKAGPAVPRWVQANGAPALAILDGGAEDVLYTLTLDPSGKIDWIYIMRNPDKLLNVVRA